MIASPKPDLVTVTVDGREIAVPKGTNVIEAARMVGVDVPYYCYHPKLSVVGNCRMCLIEMGLPAADPATKAPIMDPATGKQKINWLPRPQIGCATNASPGLHIRTTTPQIRDCREGVMEFLLINHPLDCPICDQAGECKLQEQSMGYGRGYSRYIEQKNVKPKRTPLGPRVTLDDERCILCSRCVRFCKEIVHDDVLGFTDRGSYSTLTCYPGKVLSNNYSLNTVDICPVGALTSTDFRFKMRVWFLKQSNSIDTESSVGANTVVWSREGIIYRITPRRHDEVNDTWLADSARDLYKSVRSADRLDAIQVDGADRPLENALNAAAELLRGAAGALAVVGSGRNSVEEQFLTKRLAAALGASTHLVSRVGPGDGILISADRNPNVRGALVVGLISELPAAPGGAVTSPPTPASASTSALAPSTASTTAASPAGLAPSAAPAPPAASATAASAATRSSAAPATPSAPVSAAAAASTAPTSPENPGITAAVPSAGVVRTGGLLGLGAEIDAGKVRAVVSMGEDLLAGGLTAAQLAKVTVIYLGTHANATSAAAKVVVPTLSVFEKSGTFVNQQFRLQKFSRCVPGPAGAYDDLVVLAKLIPAVGGAAEPGDLAALWAVLAGEVTALKAITFASLPESGLLLDAGAFGALPFAEGETLHYRPAKP